MGGLIMTYLWVQTFYAVANLTRFKLNILSAKRHFASHSKNPMIQLWESSREECAFWGKLKTLKLRLPSRLSTLKEKLVLPGIPSRYTVPINGRVFCAQNAIWRRENNNKSFGSPISIKVLSENRVGKILDIYLVTSSAELLNCLHLMASVLFGFCWIGYNDLIKRTAVSSCTSGLVFSLLSDAYVSSFAQCIAGTHCFGMRRTEHLESRRMSVGTCCEILTCTNLLCFYEIA